MDLQWVLSDATVVMDWYPRRVSLNWKLLKPYAKAMTGSTMVEIQCPHCAKDVELEDGASGLFDCPYCNKEFEWGSDFQIGDLKIKFLIFLFGIFSPSILYFVSLWIQFAVFRPSGWDGLLYFFISIGICVVYTLSLAIYGGLRKNKPLLQGILLSLIASYLAIYLLAEVL